MTMATDNNTVTENGAAALEGTPVTDSKGKGKAVAPAQEAYNDVNMDEDDDDEEDEEEVSFLVFLRPCAP